MRSGSSTLRLFAEIVAIVALTDCAIVFLLPQIAPGLHDTRLNVLNIVILALCAGSLLLWRITAAMARGKLSESQSSDPTVPSAIGPSRLTIAASLAVFAIGLTCSLLGAWKLGEQEKSVQAERFGRLADWVKAEVERRFNSFAYGLRGARGPFIVNSSVSRSEFQDYVASRDLPREFPGARGFGFIQRVRRDELETFTAYERVHGLPEFTPDVSGDGPLLYVIKYIEPLQENKLSLGLDFATDQKRREGLERAMRSGEVTITGKVRILRDEAQRSGCVCFLPVYRQGSNPTTPEERERDLLGWVYTPVVMSDAMRGVFDVVKGQLDIEIYDGSDTTGDDLLYDDYQTGPVGSDAPIGATTPRMFQQKTIVRVCGRLWTVWLGTTPEFDADATNITPILVGTGGTTVSLLLAMIVWGLGSGRARALSLAMRMTADLRASEEQARAALDAVKLAQFSMDRAADQIFWISSDSAILYANDSACRTLGYQRVELVGKTFSEISPNFPSQGWPAHWDEIKRRGSFTFESFHTTKDGRVLQTEVTVNYMQHGGSEFNCAMVRDITDRKRAEARLAQSERDYRGLFEQAHDAILIFRPDDEVVLEVNDRACQMYGFTRAEFIGMSLEKVSEDSALGKQQIDETLRCGTNLNVESVQYRKDGSLMPVEINAAVIEYRGERVVMSINRDVTWRKQAEAQLVKAARRDALATLSEGIAHEFNSMLLTANIFLRMPSPTPARQSESIDKAALIIHQAQSLSASLLELFAGSEQTEAPVLEIADWISDRVRHLSGLMPPGVYIKYEPGDPALRVRAEPLALEQIMRILLTNAADALPNGGDLQISVAVPQGGMGEDSRVEIRFADQGQGIPKCDQDRIFEPFFTSRKRSRRSGLGLAIAARLIEQIGGTLTFEPNKPQGSIFVIRLLRAEMGDA